MSGLNPNIAGQLLALSIPMSLYLLARPKVKPLTALLCWVQLVLCITTIFLTGSRGALLAAAPNIIIFPFIMARRTWWQRTLAIVAVSASIVCGTLLVPSQTWQRIYSLDTELTEGTMTHRTQIWEASLELFRDHPFLGVGANAHAEAAVKIIDRPLVAHNTFLSVLAELGVWGELLFLALLGAAFYCALQMPPLERTLWVVALLVWCISAGSTSLEYQKTTWLLFSLLAAHAYARRDTAPVPA